MIRKDCYIAVIGLGHIGLPLLVHYSQKGYIVSGVDSDQAKVDSLRSGNVCIEEPGLDSDRLKGLSIDTDLNLKEHSTYMIAINVNEIGGEYFLDDLLELINKIVGAVHSCSVVIRSTISPEAIDKIRTSVKINPGSGVYFSPEFLREGCALKDLEVNPEYLGTIVTGSDHNYLDTFESQVIYDASLLSFLKIANNAWRATKVSFANLMMMLLSERNLDADQFYELFISDELNVSKHYLKPGAPFGGYCLPKETKILSRFEEQFSVDFFKSVLDINDRVIRYWFSVIMQSDPSIVVFESVSFKNNTSDERSSPYVIIREMLNREGVETFLVKDQSFSSLSESDVFIASSKCPVSNNRVLNARVVKIVGL